MFKRLSTSSSLFFQSAYQHCLDRAHIRAHSFADGADRHVVGNNPPDVAVLAVSAANLVSGGSTTPAPHGSCCSLRNGLPLERRPYPRPQAAGSPVPRSLECGSDLCATQFGLYASGMHCRGAHATLACCLWSNATARGYLPSSTRPYATNDS